MGNLIEFALFASAGMLVIGALAAGIDWYEARTRR